MTIQFYCPRCKSIIAFESKHSGKKAHCTSCGQKFIIPLKDFDIPEKIEDEPQPQQPLPGFYRAVFIDSWKLFFGSDNVTPLVFVVAAVCFKFFLAYELCCGVIAFIVVWGWLLGFYLNVIHDTSFGEQKLPEIFLGTGVEFVWNIIRPFLIFLGIMVLVQLPYILTLAYMYERGLENYTLFTWQTWQSIVLNILFSLGLFLFPAAILTSAVGRDPTLLRPDYLIAPIVKALPAYIVVFLWLFTASYLELQTRQFSAGGVSTAASNLSLNLCVQVLAIVAMRAIGLFYRHYCCYFAW